MAKPRHYSPVISRFIVSVLYHEAKHRKVPMTQLTDELLVDALRGSPGWQAAISLKPTEMTKRPELSQAA
jgi:hypothetical protein